MVDKSPPSVRDIATLQRLEENFENPLYLFLTRHPKATVESMMRVRIHPPEPKHTFAAAEQRWKQDNKNALSFLGDVPRSRWHHLSFEELLADSEAVLRKLTDFLGVPYFDIMAYPYELERLRSGIGCINLSKRERVERELGEVWKHIKLPQPLGPETSDLASRLGYALPIG